MWPGARGGGRPVLPTWKDPWSEAGSLDQERTWGHLCVTGEVCRQRGHEQLSEVLTGKMGEPGKPWMGARRVVLVMWRWVTGQMPWPLSPTRLQFCESNRESSEAGPLGDQHCPQGCGSRGDRPLLEQEGRGRVEEPGLRAWTVLRAKGQP